MVIDLFCMEHPELLIMDHWDVDISGIETKTAIQRLLMMNAMVEKGDIIPSFCGTYFNSSKKPIVSSQEGSRYYECINSY